MGKKTRQSKKPKDPPKYEEIRARLEEVVSQLERGEGTLEEALAAYEEGVALVKAAHGTLDAAEKRLSILKPQPDGSFTTEEAKGPALSRPPVVGNGAEPDASCPPQDAGPETGEADEGEDR